MQSGLILGLTHQGRIYVIATQGSNPKTFILPTDCVSPGSKKPDFSPIDLNLLNARLIGRTQKSTFFL